MRNSAFLLWLFLFFSGACFVLHLSAFGQESRSDADAALALTPEEQAWISRHPVIRIQMADDSPPFEFRENKVWQGMAHDYLQEAARRLGVKIAIAEIGWTEALTDIQGPRQSVDLLLCVTRSKEREAQMLLTQPYLSFPQVILMRKQHGFVASLKDLNSATIAVEKDYVMEAWLKRDLPNARLKILSNSEDCLEAVSSGQADAYVGNLAVASYLIDRRGLVNVAVAAPSEYDSEEFAMGVRKDWPELPPLLNKALNSISPEQSQEIRQKWMAVRFEYGVKPLDILKWVLVVAAIALLFILQLRRMVTQRTEELRREVELRRARERNLAAAQRIAHLGSWIHELPSDEWTCSDEARAIFGWSAAQPVKQADFESRVHPADLPRLRERNAHAQRGQPEDIEYRIVHPDGETRHLLERAMVVYGERQRPEKIEGTVQDITERVRFQEHLLQSQKVESIGQLAGGVAHDFNNLLTSIIGFSELARMNGQNQEAVAQHLEYILQSALRGAALTRQLLAFARKNVIQPEVLNLNSVAARLEPMLRRLIGENIELVLKTDPDLAPVHADAGSLEQVIVNMAVNARDAMPNGGRLTMETSNVVLSADLPGAPDAVEGLQGPCVVLKISDSGIGMTPETIARIFEPFYTTKPEGRGTGLGLATCHGIVKQAGGKITVASEPGKGAAFTVYLPRATKATRAAEPQAEPVAVQPSLAGTETLLLVEDDKLIRKLASDSLAALGYTVLVAADGVEALKCAEQAGRPIDLLVSDVIMPHMGGPDLAARLQEKYPHVKVLFTSGYAMGALNSNGELKEGVTFIQKPYGPSQLAQTIRSILNQRS